MVTHKRLLNDSSRHFSLCFRLKGGSYMFNNTKQCNGMSMQMDRLWPFFSRMYRIYAIENWARKKMKIWNESWSYMEGTFFNFFAIESVSVVARSFMMKMNRVEITFHYNKGNNSYCPFLLLFQSLLFFGHSSRIEIKDLQRMKKK